MKHRTAALTGLLVPVALLAAGCGGDEPAPDPDRIVLAPATGDHTHAPGQGHDDRGPLGDGERAGAGGYRMTDVRLTRPEGRPGTVSFRILDRRGRPVTSYVEEQTKLLHLYVVRADLGDFRHLHPTLGKDGTWSAQVSLAGPGAYRVIAEFLPLSGDRQLALGREIRVPGAWQRTAVPTGADAASGDDGVITVTATGAASTGSNGRMRLRITNADGDPVTLGSYLGTYAHVTGFQTESGRFVHTHPYGAPEQGSYGTELTFHTTFAEPGDYRFFVQVRVDGFVHQVPVTVAVTD